MAARESVAVAFKELVEAFELASMASETQVFINIKTGKIIFLADDLDMESDEEVPDDIETSDDYLRLPDRNELNLGRDMVFSFVQKELPTEWDTVRNYFRKSGAYGRFKALLVTRDRLDDWHKFEEKAAEDALREWCEDSGIQLSDSDSMTTEEPIMADDEIAFRAAINVLHDTIESGRMPSGLPLEPDAAALHERAARHLEALLRGAALKPGPR